MITMLNTDEAIMIADALAKYVCKSVDKIVLTENNIVIIKAKQQINGIGNPFVFFDVYMTYPLYKRRTVGIHESNLLRTIRVYFPFVINFEVENKKNVHHYLNYHYDHVIYCCSVVYNTTAKQFEFKPDSGW